MGRRQWRAILIGCALTHALAASSLAQYDPTDVGTGGFTQARPDGTVGYAILEPQEPNAEGQPARFYLRANKADLTPDPSCANYCDPAADFFEALGADPLCIIDTNEASGTGVWALCQGTTQIAVLGDATASVKGFVQLTGDFGGTAASPSVVDDSHAHTGSTISGLDISADTNLAVTAPITLTGDTVGITQNAGTDVTADLEEETHATEHSLGGTDPITATNLASGCTNAQVLGGTVAGTGVECQTDATATECSSSSCNLNTATTLNSQGICLANGTNCPAEAQLLFKTVDAPSGTDPVADTTTDTLTLAATGICTITGDSTTDTLTWACTEVDGSTTNELVTLTADSGGATTGTGVTLAGGAGVATTRATNTVTFATASQEVAFLADGGSSDLTCGASAGGKAQVMDAGTLQYCDGAATSILRTITPMGPLIEADEMAVTLTFDGAQLLDLTTHDATLSIATVTGAPGTGVIQLDTAADTFEFDTGCGDRSAMTLETAQTVTGAKTFNDNVKLKFGDAGDSEIYYDATNLVIEPNAVGSGVVNVLGDLSVANTLAVGTAGGTKIADYFMVNGSTAYTIDASTGSYIPFNAAALITMEQDGTAIAVAGVRIANTYTSPSNETRSLASVFPWWALLDQNTIQPNTTNGAATVGTYESYRASPTFTKTGTNGATYTTVNMINSMPSIGTGATVTTLTHYKVTDAAGAGSTGTQIGLDVPALADGTTANIGIRNASTTVNPPPSTVTLASGGTIAPSASVINLQATGAQSTSATTAISDGQNGQILILQSVDAEDNAITIKNAANTQIGADCALTKGDTMGLIYTTAIGDWTKLWCTVGN